MWENDAAVLLRSWPRPSHHDPLCRELEQESRSGGGAMEVSRRRQAYQEDWRTTVTTIPTSPIQICTPFWSLSAKSRLNPCRWSSSAASNRVTGRSSTASISPIPIFASSGSRWLCPACKLSGGGEEAQPDRLICVAGRRGSSNAYLKRTGEEVGDGAAAREKEILCRCGESYFSWWAQCRKKIGHGPPKATHALWRWELHPFFFFFLYGDWASRFDGVHC